MQGPPSRALAAALLGLVLLQARLPSLARATVTAGPRTPRASKAGAGGGRDGASRDASAVVSRACRHHRDAAGLADAGADDVWAAVDTPVGTVALSLSRRHGGRASADATLYNVVLDDGVVGVARRVADPDAGGVASDGTQQQCAYFLLSLAATAEGSTTHARGNVHGHAQDATSPHARRLAYILNSAKGLLWPNGRIPISGYDDRFEGWYMQQILDAQHHMEVYSPVRFTGVDDEGTDADQSYVFVSNDWCDSGPSSCCATLGRNVGEQTVVLPPHARGCGVGSTVHEFGHMVGMPHEHQRPDRDDYLQLNDEALSSFALNHVLPISADGCGEGDWEVPRDPFCLHVTNRYDYGSIMHYTPAFNATVGLPWFSGKEPQFSEWVSVQSDMGGGAARGEIGNYWGLSVFDRQLLNTTYGDSVGSCIDRGLLSVNSDATSVCAALVVSGFVARPDFNGRYENTQPVGGRPAWVQVSHTDPDHQGPDATMYNLYHNSVPPAAAWLIDSNTDPSGYQGLFWSSNPGLPESGVPYRVWNGEEWTDDGPAIVHCEYDVPADDEDGSSEWAWDTAPWGPCLPDWNGAYRTRGVFCRHVSGLCAAHVVDAVGDAATVAAAADAMCSQYRQRPAAREPCYVDGQIAGCDFEGSNACASLRNRALDVIVGDDWFVNSGARGGYFDTDHTLGTADGSYVHHWSQPSDGVSSAITSPPLITNGGECTISFAYNIHGGPGVAQLSIDVTRGDNNGWFYGGGQDLTTVWSDDSTEGWVEESVALPAYDGAVWASFVIRRLTGVSNFGLDDVSFSGCGEDPTAPHAPGQVFARPLPRGGSIAVSWQAAFFASEAPTYVVEATQVGLEAPVTATVGTNTLEVTLDGFANGVPVSVTVSAANQFGSSTSDAFVVTPVDTKAPSFGAAGAPQVSSQPGGVTGSSVSIVGTLDEAGEVFAFAVASGSASGGVGTGAGENVTAVDVVAQGAVATVAEAGGGAFTVTATGLQSETSYDVYVVARDAAVPANTQAHPMVLHATTADVTAPTFTTIPTTTNNAHTRLSHGVEVTAALSEPGTVFVAVVPRQHTTSSGSMLTADEVAGKPGGGGGDGGDATLAEHVVARAAMVSLLAEDPITVRVTGLTNDTAYTAFVVGSDAGASKYGNLMPDGAVQRIDFDTHAACDAVALIGFAHATQMNGPWCRVASAGHLVAGYRQASADTAGPEAFPLQLTYDASDGGFGSTFRWRAHDGGVLVAEEASASSLSDAVLPSAGVAWREWWHSALAPTPEPVVVRCIDDTIALPPLTASQNAATTTAFAVGITASLANTGTSVVDVYAVAMPAGCCSPQPSWVRAVAVAAATNGTIPSDVIASTVTTGVVLDAGGDDTAVAMTLTGVSPGTQYSVFVVAAAPGCLEFVVSDAVEVVAATHDLCDAVLIDGFTLASDAAGAPVSGTYCYDSSAAATDGVVVLRRAHGVHGATLTMAPAEFSSPSASVDTADALEWRLRVDDSDADSPGVVAVLPGATAGEEVPQSGVTWLEADHMYAGGDFRAGVPVSVVCARDLVPSAPAFTQTPAAAALDLTAVVATQLSGPGTVYVVVEPAGAPTPTAAEVRNGVAAGNSHATATSRATSDAAGADVAVTVAGLQPSTAYRAFVVAEDAACTPTLMADGAVAVIDFTTSATAAPAFTSAPTVASHEGSLQATAAFISFALDEPGTVFWLAVAAGAEAPSALEVRIASGTAAGSAAASGFGRVDTVVVDALAPSAAYDVYFVAEDTDTPPSLSATPVSASLMTPALCTSIVTSGFVKPQFDTHLCVQPALHNGRARYVDALDPNGEWNIYWNDVYGPRFYFDDDTDHTGSVAYIDVADTRTRAVPGALWRQWDWDVQRWVSRPASVHCMDDPVHAAGPPAFVAGAPVLDEASGAVLRLRVKIDAPGRVHAVVVPRDDPAGAPSAVQVAAGTDAADGAPLASANVLVTTAFADAVLEVAGVPPSQEVDVYVASATPRCAAGAADAAASVASAGAGTGQTPAKLQLTTGSYCMQAEASGFSAESTQDTFPEIDGVYCHSADDQDALVNGVGHWARPADASGRARHVYYTPDIDTGRWIIDQDLTLDTSNYVGSVTPPRDAAVNAPPERGWWQYSWAQAQWLNLPDAAFVCVAHTPEDVVPAQWIGVPEVAETSPTTVTMSVPLTTASRVHAMAVSPGTAAPTSAADVIAGVDGDAASAIAAVVSVSQLSHEVGLFTLAGLPAAGSVDVYAVAVPPCSDADAPDTPAGASEVVAIHGVTTAQYCPELRVAGIGDPDLEGSYCHDPTAVDALIDGLGHWQRGADVARHVNYRAGRNQWFIDRDDEDEPYNVLAVADRMGTSDVPPESGWWRYDFDLAEWQQEDGATVTCAPRLEATVLTLDQPEPPPSGASQNPAAVDDAVVTVSLTLNRGATAWLVAVAAGSSAPSAAQVRAGADAGGITALGVVSALSVAADDATDIDIELTTGQVVQVDVYVVADPVSVCPGARPLATAVLAGGGVVLGRDGGSDDGNEGVGDGSGSDDGPGDGEVPEDETAAACAGSASTAAVAACAAVAALAALAHLGAA